MNMRAFLITAIFVLIIFETEGIKVMLGRIGSRGRVSSGRSTFGQNSSSRRSSLTGWNQPMNNYFKGPGSGNGNPTSLSEFAFGPSRTNMQPKYSLTNNNSPSHNPLGGHPEQPVGDAYHHTGVLPGYLALNLYRNHDYHSSTTTSKVI